MKNFESIRRLAEARSNAKLLVENLGIMDTATDIDKRIAQDAQYQIAKDALVAADAAYQEAIRKLSPDELGELANWKNHQSF